MAMKYKVIYTGNSTRGFEFESESRDSLKHLKTEYRAAGNDTVCVYDAKTDKLISMSKYTIEKGGKFYRCHV